MPDSQLPDAEREMQPLLRKIQLLQLFILAAAIPSFHYWEIRLADREELGERSARVEFVKVDLDPGGFGELRLAGAWKLTGEDSGFGGFSALAVDGGALVALTDFGVLARFPKPAGASAMALIGELPGGPGDRRFKRNRDSEALLRDPAGRGWWVAFENRNELWLYDERFLRPLGRVAFGRQRWPLNKGIEALAQAETDILAFPEQGRTVVRIRGLSERSVPIDLPRGRISDAVQLPDGRLWVLHRNLTPFGFRNSLTELERTTAGYRFGQSLRLGLSRLDNAEALAAERLPNGTTRLWVMTDDNLQRPMRTLLLALDVPPKRPPPRPSS
jgi:hypothetical protein